VLARFGEVRFGRNNKSYVRCGVERQGRARSGSAGQSRAAHGKVRFCEVG